ncbi:MAG TPA: YihY/virulence factor BrkB family protein [Blastocatellia bacterium]|nr:YihY/virulence factor BrkB family protein [Blastocatellia bacterium]
MGRMLGGITIKELARRVWNEIWEDKCMNRAAELGFYSMMALFPLLIFLLTLLSLIPGAHEVIMGYLREVMPGEAMSLVDAWMTTVFAKSSRGLLSFSLLFTLWAASSGVVALIEVLNVAYEVEEARPFWKQRLVAIALTITLTVLVIGGAMLMTYGDDLAAWVLGQAGLGGAIGIIWRFMNYVVGLAMLLLGIAVIYHFGPNVKQKWNWTVPGTLFAVLAFIVVSYLFSLYLRFAPGYDATYGSLGAVVVLMLWLYLMGLVIMIGGEINSEIQRASGKPRIEKEQPDHQEAA